MSVAITIDAAAVTTAANFLEQFLTDQVPEGDFTAGTALRDLTVQALAAVVTFLRADAAQIRQLQSLVTVQAATSGDAEALSDAVTGILSNLLITPKGGGTARGYAIAHATQAVDVFISTSTRFTYSAGRVFVVDSADTLFVAASELTPVIDTDGAVLDYEFRIPLVAVAVGPAYNIAPGLFAAFDRFNPYVTHIETTITFSGGKGPETVTEVLARAPTALAVRNLINTRSITATLDDNFDDLETVLVVGMGDPEMRRDIVPTIAPTLRFHVGGAVDIYVRTPLVETSFTGTVGGLFARPDGVVAIFRDGAHSFAAVLPGDIIRVTDGLPVVPAEFLVVANAGTDLLISETSPFPIATDEGSPTTTVTYTIGRLGPSYTDVLAGGGGQPYTTGTTSRTAATPGRITLPGGPVMDVLDVALLDPPAGEAAFKSSLDGFVHFINHVNATPATMTPTQGLEFQTIVQNPLYAQSASQWLEVGVGTTDLPTRFDGYQLRVRYRTIASFDAIDAFVRGARERVSAAYQLPRGHHPVVVALTLTYRLRTSATTLLDDAAIAQLIVDYVNTFDAATQALDVSTVLQLVRTAYPDIANIVPQTVGGALLTITYTLRAPTGDVLTYATTDVVEVSTVKQTGGPTLDLAAYGVSARTLRYVANTLDVQVRQEDR